MLRRFIGVLAGALLVLIPTAPVATAAPPVRLSECSAELFHGDRRLGPDHLPVLGRVGEQLHGYDRTGHRSVGTFLATYYDEAAGSFRFPPQDGYVLRPDGTPIRWQQHLPPGSRIDRYGSEFGAFLAPEGARYASRSIPPQNLVGNPAAGCNYHDYLVVKDFQVDAGPIAPWFFQPGGGLQYQLDGALVPGSPARLNVMWLLDNGYLRRLV
jgi:hypothetical protein